MFAINIAECRAVVHYLAIKRARDERSRFLAPASHFDGNLAVSEDLTAN